MTRHGPVTVAVLGGGDPRRAVAVRDAIASWLATTPRGRPARRSGGTAARRRDPAASCWSAPGRATRADHGQGPPPARRGRRGGRRPARPRAAPRRAAPRRRAGRRGEDPLRPGPQPRRRSTGSWSTGPWQGKLVVRLKGGDPYVFGRGGEEALACAAAGVPVTVVPGVTSAIAAPAVAGIPVTHRGVAHEFTVVSGHVPPAASGVAGGLAGAGPDARHAGDPHGPEEPAGDRRHADRGGQSGATPAAVVQEGTTGAQKQHVVHVGHRRRRHRGGRDPAAGGGGRRRGGRRPTA